MKRLFPAFYELARGLRSNARVRYVVAFLLASGCAVAQHEAPSTEADAADTDGAVDAHPADAHADARTDGAPPDAAVLPDAAVVDAARPDAAIDAPPPPDAAIDRPLDDLRLDSIDPNNGLAQATLVGALVTGSGFDATTTATIGGTAATNCSLVSATQLRCDISAGTPSHADVVVHRGAATATLAAGFTWTAVSTDVTWCDVQWPPSVTATANTASPYIYGQIYQAGVTDTSATPAAGIAGQLGWGTPQSDPRTDNTWRFVDAVPNPSYDFSQNNDEYYARVALPAGTYGYIYRFTRDGGLHYTYCDLATANNGFDPAQEGALTVTP